MNNMQILAMDRTGETGEPIFRTPCSVGSGEVGAPIPDAVAVGALEMMREAYAHWDADREYKVGKILLALIGHNKGYDKRADAWTAAMLGEPNAANPVHDKRCPAALNMSDPCKCGETS